jgi:tight adherence protein C
MMELLAAAVFILVASATALIGFRLWNQRTKALVRLSPPTQVPEYLPSPSLIWQQLVNWIGNVVPASPKDLPLLKRRLVRAGFRNPNAVRLFHGARGFCAGLLALAGLFLAVHTGASTGNAAMVIGGLATLGYLIPVRYLGWAIARRKRAIERGLPNALD